MESIDTLQSLLRSKKDELDSKNQELRDQGMMNVGQENTAKFEMIMNLSQSLTDAQTKQTTDQFALDKVNQQLLAMGVASSPGKPVTKRD